MAQYGEATFHTLLDQDGRLPALERTGGVVLIPVPFAGADHVQFRGRGSPTLTLTINLESDAEVASMTAYLGDGVPRRLEDPFGLGTNLDAMCLMAFTAERLGWMPDWVARATWVQVGGP